VLESDYPDSPADVLSWHLVSNLGVGTDPGAEEVPSSRVWPVQAKSEPDEPDDCITVYHTTGNVDGRSPHDGSVWEHLGFQVKVRGATHRSGYVKANEVRDALADVTRSYWKTVTVPAETGTAGTGYRLETVDPGPVLDLGKETTSPRYVFTINGLMTIDPNP
jgi:hypothetical protein